MDSIERLKDCLAGHPSISYEVSGDLLSVPAADSSGFDVVLQEAGETTTISLDGWHEDFEDPGEAIRCFMFALSPRCRLRVVSRGDLDCNWTLESQHGDGWVTVSTTGLLLIPFWRRKAVRYLQNHRV